MMGRNKFSRKIQFRDRRPKSVSRSARIRCEASLPPLHAEWVLDDLHIGTTTSDHSHVWLDLRQFHWLPSCTTFHHGTLDERAHCIYHLFTKLKISRESCFFIMAFAHSELLSRRCEVSPWDPSECPCVLMARPQSTFVLALQRCMVIEINMCANKTGLGIHSLIICFSLCHLQDTFSLAHSSFDRYLIYNSGISKI